ncbi:pentapeptide repeat-containing protein [Actinidia rufa]|uniref:Pentapeptide repeat-containing protein n=1 Tax=Actinidia rufa TaxID=165716 RepID=A0A7J0G847_9ERIC|nr:pentapeptide repeat-containing protein [Actinidia rufa]
MIHRKVFYKFLNFQKQNTEFAESRNWKTLVSTALAAAVVILGVDKSALADLNKFEAEQRGEFGIGSAAQFGSADLRKAVHVNENFRFSPLPQQVLNEANLTNAVLARSVLTRSDLGGAMIEGADFSDALLDLPQKQDLCKYASGTNPATGVSTRVILGCGNSRWNAYGSPSSPRLSAPPPKLLDRDGFCDPATGLCDAN